MVLALPTFNMLTKRNLTYQDFVTPVFLLGGIIIGIAVGVLAGAYPSFYLASFNPVEILKPLDGSAKRNIIIRRVLTTFQYAVAIALTICTIVIYTQIDYLLNRNLGFDKNHLLIIENINSSEMASRNLIKSEMAKIDGITMAATGSYLPGVGGMRMSVLPEGADQNETQLLTVIDVDADFIPALGIEVVKGRNFSDNMPTDTIEAVIINQTASALFGWDNPVGRTVNLVQRRPGGSEFIPKKVIGLVKDFHTESLHSPISPIVLVRTNPNLSNLILRVDPNKLSGAIARVETRWSELAPDIPFDYSFLDATLEARYGSETRLGKITLIFTILAVFIACLGILGISAFSARHRMREVCIRKVFGASTANIMMLLSKNMMLTVLIANALAWPAAFFAVNKWLEGFAFRTDISWEPFVLAGFINMIIAFMTASIQSLIVARERPAKVLRYE